MTVRPCGLPRRFACIAYDSILLAAVLILATALLLPLTGGRAIESGSNLYRAYLAACCFGYFAWQWIHGGRTLGMRAWRVKIESTTGTAPTWSQSGLRFAGALLSWLLLGTGFLWSLVDSQQRGLPDLLSGTRLLVTERSQRPEIDRQIRS